MRSYEEVMAILRGETLPAWCYLDTITLPPPPPHTHTLLTLLTHPLLHVPFERHSPYPPLIHFLLLHHHHHHHHYCHHHHYHHYPIRTSLYRIQQQQKEQEQNNLGAGTRYKGESPLTNRSRGSGGGGFSEADAGGLSIHTIVSQS